MALAAPGSPAARCDSHAVAPSTAADTCTATRPIGGATLETTVPRSPNQSARDTSGPAYAFASGAATDTMPNVDATTGTVTACATPVSASVAPTGYAYGGKPAVAQRVASEPNMSSPATARADSCSPTSKTDQGSITSTAATATASAASPSPRRPSSCAEPATPSIRSDRSAEYGIPVTTA